MRIGCGWSDEMKKEKQRQRLAASEQSNERTALQSANEIIMIFEMSQAL